MSPKNPQRASDPRNPSPRKQNQDPSQTPATTQHPFPWWQIRARRRKSKQRNTNGNAPAPPKRSTTRPCSPTRAPTPTDPDDEPPNTNWSITWAAVAAGGIEFDPRWHWDKHGNKLPDSNGDTARILAELGNEEFEEWMEEVGGRLGNWGENRGVDLVFDRAALEYHLIFERLKAQWARESPLSW